MSYRHPHTGGPDCPCGPCQRRRADRAAARAAAARRRHLATVAERDGYVCQLCGDPVQMDAGWPAVTDRRRSVNLLYPVLDHVLPIALGGSDGPANLQLAHWGCNSRKGARV
jgi:5-methylcytosine-specific restriction endonuclease McrA